MLQFVFTCYAFAREDYQRLYAQIVRVRSACNFSSQHFEQIQAILTLFRSYFPGLVARRLTKRLRHVLEF